MSLYIDEATGKLVNIYAPYKGYSRLDTAEIRAAAGVVEIEVDTPPSEYADYPDRYNVIEDWGATARPYVVYARKASGAIRKAELAKLLATYKVDLDPLKGALIAALLAGGDSVDAKIAALRADAVSAKERYAAEVKSVNSNLS